jgi:hypothetical protein
MDDGNLQIVIQKQFAMGTGRTDERGTPPSRLMSWKLLTVLDRRETVLRNTFWVRGTFRIPKMPRCGWRRAPYYGQLF